MDINLNLYHNGKVRDVYNMGLNRENLLIVSSDRISAFDVVLPTLIPDKGKILNEISLFWFNKLPITSHILENNDYSSNLKYQDGLDEMLDRRSMYAVKCKRINIECIVRSHITGSAWKEYQATGSVAGIKLRKGLKHSEKLEFPLFTPSLKNDTGHDENVTFEKMVELYGKELCEKIKKKSLLIYYLASDYLLNKGIILADSKFEFGLLDDEIILIDEVLTPDSSRFWKVETYTEGTEQVSLDKQILRNYLEEIGWNKEAPGPELPQDIIDQIREKYLEIYKIILGKEF